MCQNVATTQPMVQGILTHEFIHMFDLCRHDLDFKNIDHLACTEIRAANLTHCSFFSASSQGDASLFKIKAAHQDCVKTKALFSVLAVRKVIYFIFFILILYFKQLKVMEGSSGVAKKEKMISYPNKV